MNAARMRLSAASGALLAAVVVVLQAPQPATGPTTAVELRSTGMPLAPET